MNDELDQRIRALEAERLRPVPGQERTPKRPKGRPLASMADDFLDRLRRDFPQWHTSKGNKRSAE